MENGNLNFILIVYLQVDIKIFMYVLGVKNKIPKSYTVIINKNKVCKWSNMILCFN